MISCVTVCSHWVSLSCICILVLFYYAFSVLPWLMKTNLVSALLLRFPHCFHWNFPISFIGEMVEQLISLEIFLFFITGIKSNILDNYFLWLSSSEIELGWKTSNGWEGSFLQIDHFSFLYTSTLLKGSWGKEKWSMYIDHFSVFWNFSADRPLCLSAFN